MNKIFHYLQLLVFPFSFIAVFYIVYGTYFERAYTIQYVGYGVLSMGIGFAFASMGDIRKISKKEEKIFLDNSRYKKIIRWHFIYGVIAILTCLFFVSMKWFGKQPVADGYYNLGLNFFPVVIAIFFNIKQMQDKRAYFLLKNK